jgi:hypothetical protein
VAVRQFSSAAVASGVATITIRTGGYQSWRITQISTEAPSAPSIGGTCKIRRNGAIIVPFMVPTGDVASGDPPVDITPADSVTVVWTGLSAGTVVAATVTYAVA